MQGRREPRIVPAIAAFLLLLTGCSSEPDEAQVRKFFESKRPVLERILEMSNQDYARTKVTRIAPTFTRLENNWGWPRPDSELGVSADRWNEYRELFNEAELPHGIDRAGEVGNGIYFPLWGYGLADNSHEKGIMFSPSAPTDVEGESRRIRYKPLADNWYYFEWTTW
jgi:hypothetical protein